MSRRPTLFDMSADGKRCVRFPESDVPHIGADEALGADQVRQTSPALPQVSEAEIARHYAALARMNYDLDFGFYPLGSCTMKYNPKAIQQAAALPGWTGLHPATPASCAQGALQIMWLLEQMLAQIAGLPAVSLQPPAGAAGEFTCLRVFRAYHDSRGDHARTAVIVPDTAHGTNPASVARCGYSSRPLQSGPDGRINLEALQDALDDGTAAVMLTNPNTLGLFETDIVAIAEAVHDAGALLYCDGANMNAMLGYGRPGDMGFDAMHYNLHKTFGTPHGGGGPGSGPIAVTAALEPFLPVPRISREGNRFEWDWDRPQSIGLVHGFYGNFLVVIQAYAYILSLGAEGLREASRTAVLNANYLLQGLADAYELAYPGPCMHECVFSAQELQRETGVRAADLAKRLLDYDIHPPTMYFPLVVKEALMIEPTETESRATLDRFIEVMLTLHEEAHTDPQGLQSAPHKTPVGRLDELQAARKPVLRWQPEQ